MITSTYGMITCAMTALLSLVLIPYFIANVYCYWFLFWYYRQKLRMRLLLGLEFISISLFLIIFIIYVRYAHNFAGCVVMLVAAYVVSHILLLRWYYPRKPVKLLFTMVGSSLIITAALMAFYLIFIFNPLCSLLTG